VCEADLNDIVPILSNPFQCKQSATAVWESFFLPSKHDVLVRKPFLVCIAHQHRNPTLLMTNVKLEKESEDCFKIQSRFSDFSVFSVCWSHTLMSSSVCLQSAMCPTDQRLVSEPSLAMNLCNFPQCFHMRMTVLVFTKFNCKPFAATEKSDQVDTSVCVNGTSA